MPCLYTYLGIPPLKSDAILTITVVNINDNAPEFIDTPNCTNVAESVEAGDVVAALSAVDRDMLGLTYGLAANVNRQVLFHYKWRYVYMYVRTYKSIRMYITYIL